MVQSDANDIAIPQPGSELFTHLEPEPMDQLDIFGPQTPEVFL